jgi:CubicO group peptidase (beta-lactamase class C family)
MTGFSNAGLDEIRGWMRGYVDSKKLPGALLLLALRGEIALFDAYGWRWIEADKPFERDTIVRIHSMTKPVTAVAALILLEEGALGLDDPVSRFIPSFASLTANRCGIEDRIEPVPVERPMTVRHLLTHTSGLTYGEGNLGAVARMYEERRTDFGTDDGPLSEVVDRLAEIPLLFEPGTAWNYGVSTDVLGRVVEIASGLPLDRFMQERILDPLGLADTAFHVPREKVDRFAALYQATDGGLRLLETPAGSPQAGDVITLSGGGGLVSTALDYFRFAEVLRQGGAIGGVRVLDESTVRLMTSDQLGQDLAALGQPTFNETTTAGVGFGLGVSVVLDPSRSAWRSTRGEFGWGGYASTAFWVDPAQEITAIFLTQALPSDRYPIRGELRALVADALSATVSP